LPAHVFQHIGYNFFYKYRRNKTAKIVKSVKLAIPSQGISVNRQSKTIWIPSLKLSLKYGFPGNFEKVNQIEIGEEYAYVSVSVSEPKLIQAKKWIGVDRNTVGHIVVVSDPETGAVIKLGKSAFHVHQKYKNIRRRLQKKGKYKKARQIKDKERRITRDINHKISRKIVDVAKESGKGIKLEDLTGIKSSKHNKKSFRRIKNSWPFYQLQTQIEYKAKLLGVEVAYVDPAYTSQICSRCGLIGDRNKKKFKCSHCGHVDQADANAGFNIAERPRIDRSAKDRDLVEGNTDIPKAVLARIRS